MIITNTFECSEEQLYRVINRKEIQRPTFRALAQVDFGATKTSKEGTSLKDKGSNESCKNTRESYLTLFQMSSSGINEYFAFIFLLLLRFKLSQKY